MDTITPRASASLDAPARSAQPAAPGEGRYDIYRYIHKSLRQRLCQSLVQFGRLDTGDAREVHAALAELEDLCRTLRGHVAHEDAHLRPALEAAEPDASCRTTLEHEQHLRELDALQAEARTLRDAPPGQRPALTLALYRHLALFVAENLEHMHAEESENNRVLWARYDDAAIQAIEGRILASMDPAENLASLQGIAQAVSVQELAELLSGVRSMAPPEAFEGLLAALAPCQPPQRWTAVLQALGVVAPCEA